MKTSEVQTDRPYTPADGISAQSGDVVLRNVLVVSGKAGGPGTLAGLAVNQGTAPAELTVATEGTSTPVKVSVPAGASVQLSGSGTTMNTLSSVKAAPGALANVTFTTDAGGSTTVAVPVLYPNPPYESYAPAGFTPRATPSPTAEESAAH